MTCENEALERLLFCSYSLEGVDLRLYFAFADSEPSLDSKVI